MTDSSNTSYDMGYDLNSLYKENLTTKDLVEIVQSWMDEKELPDLPNDMVALLLITNDNDIEATKRNITAYFEAKSDVPELFDNRNVDASDVIKALNTVLIVCSPIRTQDNCVVIITKLLDTNYRHFDLTSIVKLGFMIVDLSLMNHPPMGLHSIVDMEGSGIMHLTHFKLQILKKFFHFVQYALPIPLRFVHVLNTNIVFYRFLGLARIVMKPEILKLVRIHKPGAHEIRDFLKDYVSVQCLPQEYGGDLPTIPELQVTNTDQLHGLTPYFVAEEKSRKAPRTVEKKSFSKKISYNPFSERAQEDSNINEIKTSKISRKSSSKNEDVIP